VVVLANMPLSHTHQHDGRRRLLHDDHDDDDHDDKHDDDHEHDHDDDHEHESDDEEHGHEHEKAAAPGSRGSSSQQKRSSKTLSEEDLIAYHFHPTPPMSTYLVAWVIGELSHNERQCELALPLSPVASSSGTGRRLQHEDHKAEATSNGRRNVTVRVWGTSDRVQQFGHARDVACASLQEMEQLTQVSATV
jgi:hypothetical protein